MRAALLELIAEQSYESITVTAITKRASVSRPTFYLHYKSKDDLLLDHLDLVFEQYIKIVEPHMQDNEIGDQIGVEVFKMLEDQTLLLKTIVDSGADHLLHQRFEAYSRRMVEQFIEINSNSHTLSPQVLDYVADYLSGALWAIIKHWLISDMSAPAEVVGRIFHALIYPAMTNILINGALDGIFD
jgi:AcrR family transcriptional regulator